MSSWIDTPDELAVRQEDRAVESGDLGDIDWDFVPGSGPYALDDPKHPTYHSRYSVLWDNRLGK